MEDNRNAYINLDQRCTREVNTEMHINSLRTRFILNNIYKFILSLTGNALHLHYIKRLMLFNEKISVCFENRMKRTNIVYSADRMQRFSMLK
jgi:hypothetical protein